MYAGKLSKKTFLVYLIKLKYIKTPFGLITIKSNKNTPDIDSR